MGIISVGLSSLIGTTHRNSVYLPHSSSLFTKFRFPAKASRLGTFLQLALTDHSFHASFSAQCEFFFTMTSCSLACDLRYLGVIALFRLRLVLFRSSSKCEAGDRRTEAKIYRKPRPFWTWDCAPNTSQDREASTSWVGD